MMYVVRAEFIDCSCDECGGSGASKLGCFGPFREPRDAESAALNLTERGMCVAATIETVRNYAKPGTMEANDVKDE